MLLGQSSEGSCSTFALLGCCSGTSLTSPQRESISLVLQIVAISSQFPRSKPAHMGVALCAGRARGRRLRAAPKVKVRPRPKRRARSPPRPPRLRPRPSPRRESTKSAVMVVKSCSGVVEQEAVLEAWLKEPEGVSTSTYTG